MSLKNSAGFSLAVTIAISVAACLAPTEPDPSLDPVSSGGAALTAVTGFGSNPGNLSMYVYSPAGVPANAPLVVAMHGCSMTASDYVNAGWNQLADQWKFHVVYPQSGSATKCFTWYDTTNTARDSGEALSIKQMVDYMKANDSIDPKRVFVTGLSAGGAMTAVMLAAYPDVFAGGAIMAGIPYRCATASNIGTCMSGSVSETAAQWGDLVRNADSSYHGPYPKVSIWQGSSDAVVSTANMGELVLQWTNVNGIDATADATGTVSGANHAEYKDASGNTLVETYTIPNMGHGTAIKSGFAPAGGCGQAGAYILDAGICSTYYAGVFFGLGAAAAPPPDGGTGGAGGGTTTSSSSTSVSSSSSTTSSSSSSSSSSTSTSSSGGGFTCQEFYDSNYNHVVKGRAVRCGAYNSYVCAVGSGENAGLWTLIPTWLRETGPSYYEVGRCP